MKSIFNCKNKYSFQQALKYSGFNILNIASLGDIKGNNLTTKYFQKWFFAKLVLGMCQPF